MVTVDVETVDVDAEDVAVEVETVEVFVDSVVVEAVTVDVELKPKRTGSNNSFWSVYALFLFKKFRNSKHKEIAQVKLIFMLTEEQ